MVLQWLCRRHLIPDSELADALGIPPTNYSRRKDSDDYPSFEELTLLAEHYGLSKRSLQIAFGYLDRDALPLLDEWGMRQYVEQGGGETPLFPTVGGGVMTEPRVVHRPRRQRRVDAPPGP